MGQPATVRRRRRAAPPPGHLDYEAAAAYLGMGRSELQRHVGAGEIAVYRPRPEAKNSSAFFPVAELDRFREERTRRAGEPQAPRRRRVR